MSTLQIWETVRASNGLAFVRLDDRTTYQTVSFTGTAGQSAAFDADTSVISIKADTDCAVRIGANPTAVATDLPLSAGNVCNLAVDPGQKISVIAIAAGGLAASRVVTGTTGVIKASGGQVYGLSAYNVNAAVRYLHLYNKATAPTLSTDTPIYTVPLPAAGRIDINFTALGLAFATGISWAYTTDDVAIPVTAGTSTELHFSATYR